MPVDLRNVIWVTQRISQLFVCVNIVNGRSYCSEYEEAVPTLIEVDLYIIAFVQSRWLESCQHVFIPSFPGHNPGCGFFDILLKYAILYIPEKSCSKVCSHFGRFVNVHISLLFAS